MSDVVVPEDFPRNPFPASLSGAQPKLAARLIDGRFIVGLTLDERVERYLVCVDLVEQLLDFCTREAGEHPTWTQEELLSWVERGVRNKQTTWRLGAAEIDWIVAQMRAQYDAAQKG